jgi:hypothetical protein
MGGFTVNDMQKIGPGLFTAGAESQRMRIHEPHRIVKAQIGPDGQLEVVRQYPSNMAYGNGLPFPDKVVKEIYGVVDGRIALINTVEGKHIPPQLMPERIEFNE